MDIIAHSKSLDIRNIASMSHGTGAKYLECLVDEIHDCLIAYQWKRKLPVSIPENHVIISF